ncbi:hypothetical protein ES703_75293 [subsurface metagenome]
MVYVLWNIDFSVPWVLVFAHYTLFIVDIYCVYIYIRVCVYTKNIPYCRGYLVFYSSGGACSVGML